MNSNFGESARFKEFLIPDWRSFTVVSKPVFTDVPETFVLLFKILPL